MATRVKTPAAAVAVPQSRSDCAAYIKQLGDVQRDFERQRAQMNDAIAAIAKTHEPMLAQLSQRAEALSAGIQTWCEANRTAICGAQSKTANLVTGEVAWRQRPPSVRIRDAEQVIETFKRLGLAHLVRVKEEVNKDAILAEPDTVRGVAGISLVTGVEDFTITPLQVEVSAP